MRTSSPGSSSFLCRRLARADTLMSVGYPMTGTGLPDTVARHWPLLRFKEVELPPTFPDGGSRSHGGGASSPSAKIKDASSAGDQDRPARVLRSRQHRHIKPPNWLLGDSEARELIGNERFEGGVREIIW